MLRWAGLGAAAMACAAGAATAAPVLDLRGAALRVVVIPEARGAIAVTVLTRNPRLPLRVTRSGQRVFVSGDVARLSPTCRSEAGAESVTIDGRGRFPLSTLPRVVVRMPLNAHILADGAVFGAVGRTAALDLANRGCGDWVIANVRGRLRVNQSGPGLARLGDVGSADISVDGAGGVILRQVRRGLMAVSSGAGHLTAAAVDGPLNARVAGAGDIWVRQGLVNPMIASIAGSGRIRFGGVARSLQASVAGSGVVAAAHVSGGVRREVFGAGRIIVGR